VHVAAGLAAIAGGGPELEREALLEYLHYGSTSRVVQRLDWTRAPQAVRRAAAVRARVAVRARRSVT